VGNTKVLVTNDGLGTNLQDLYPGGNVAFAGKQGVNRAKIGTVDCRHCLVLPAESWQEGCQYDYGKQD